MKDSFIDQNHELFVVFCVSMISARLNVSLPRMFSTVRRSRFQRTQNFGMTSPVSQFCAINVLVSRVRSPPIPSGEVEFRRTSLHSAIPRRGSSILLTFCSSHDYRCRFPSSSHPLYLDTTFLLATVCRQINDNHALGSPRTGQIEKDKC